MIESSALRKGVTFILDGELFKVLDYSHSKPGRGLATIRVKTINLRTGANVEKTFSSSVKVEDIRLDYHTAQYLYNNGEEYFFMDTETFEQPGFAAKSLGDTTNYLKENMEIKITYYEGETIDIELPLTVNLKVVQAEPAVRGDTATGVLKKVKMETGLELSVPGFVEVGDELKIDTRDGSYISRA